MASTREIVTGGREVVRFVRGDGKLEEGEFEGGWGRGGHSGEGFRVGAKGKWVNEGEREAWGHGIGRFEGAEIVGWRWRSDGAMHRMQVVSLHA